MSRNRTYQFSKSIGVLLWLFGLFLQSCSIRGKELGLTPIPIRYLNGNLASHVNGCFPRETRAKFQRLNEEGFLGGNVPDDGRIENDNDIRKHFMFLFYHCLKLKTPGDMFNDEDNRNDFINEFTRVRGNADLIWEPIAVNWQDNGRRQIPLPPHMVEFRLRELFVGFRDAGNLDHEGALDIFRLAESEIGHAPYYMDTNRVDNRVDIDHLFRDNSITIELPLFLHRQKSLLIDNLIRVPTPEQITGLIREPANYWSGRRTRGFVL